MTTATAGGDGGGGSVDDTALLAWVDQAIAASTLPSLSQQEIMAILSGDAPLPPSDPFLGIASGLYDDIEATTDRVRAALSQRDKLLAVYMEGVKGMQTAGNEFVPDANGTLRLTAGAVKGGCRVCHAAAHAAF